MRTEEASRSGHPGILCACRACSTSFPWFSSKGLNLIDGVYVFVFALLATSYERLRCAHVSVVEFILQALNSWGNRNWLCAINTRHSTVALDKFRNHLSLTKGI
jgi:hypothetical protein